ncbi:tetratricopeptide repeat protein [Thiocapsa sp.]|nr:tetratricopeptide repeat protein [Thiocapsa sp.]
MRSQVRSVSILLLGITIALILWLYSLALPGYALFDDWPSLDGLSKIQDIHSGLVYVSTGITGPLGRPLSLSTFALQASSWPENMSALLSVNFGVHALATLMTFFLAVGLARLRIPEKTVSSWIGLGVAALWGMSPFLATTHLMLIQRMTSLSALFVLMGLTAFVWAQLLKDRQSWRVRLMLVCGLGFGTLCAALSKENGALLSLFALVILWLWVPPANRLRGAVERSLILLLAVVPALLLVGYLAIRLPGILEHGYGPHRYFSPLERMMGQPVVLLDYLRNLLLPRAAAVSPFTDRWPVPSGWLDPLSTLLAAGFWIALILTALMLRKKAPYLLFGLTFFLVGHLLESSFIGLEIYFAHRNYLPAFGLYFALIFGLFCIAVRYRRLVIIAISSYVLIFMVILFQVTSQWNDALPNARIWLDENPWSQRGAQFLTTQLVRKGDLQGARQVLDAAVEQNPGLALVQIQRTGLCLGQEEEFPRLLNEVISVLHTANYQPLAAYELAKFANADPAHLCPSRDYSALSRMADALLQNPPYAQNKNVRSQLILTKAFAEVETGDIKKANDYFRESFRLSPNLDVLFYGLSLMANAGEYDQVYAFLAEARELSPRSRLERSLWLKRLDDFLEIMRESQRIDSGRLLSVLVCQDVPGSSFLSFLEGRFRGQDQPTPSASAILDSAAVL